MQILNFEPDRAFVRAAKWYVVFVKTFEEYRFAERLQSKLDADKYVVFVPTKDRSFRKKDVIKLHSVLLFPGYVFVASTDDPDKCFETLSPIVRNDETAYKMLGDEESLRCAVVDERDKALLMRLMNKEFHIAAIEAVDVGDSVVIADGALESLEGRVKKINKYRQTVDVEFEMFGRMQSVTLALDVVERRV